MQRTTQTNCSQSPRVRFSATRVVSLIDTFNSLNTVGYLLGVYGYFFGPYLDFCLELALETWAKASLTQSLWVHDPNHSHLLASFQWSGLSDQRTLHWTECCLQVQKWCPYKGREVVPEPVCANKVRNGPPSANQGFSTASQGVDGRCKVYLRWLNS